RPRMGGARGGAYRALVGRSSLQRLRADRGVTASRRGPMLTLRRTSALHVPGPRCVRYLSDDRHPGPEPPVAPRVGSRSSSKSGYKSQNRLPTGSQEVYERWGRGLAPSIWRMSVEMVFAGRIFTLSDARQRARIRASKREIEMSKRPRILLVSVCAAFALLTATTVPAFDGQEAGLIPGGGPVR